MKIVYTPGRLVCYVLYFKAWQLHVRRFGQSIVLEIFFVGDSKLAFFHHNFSQKRVKPLQRFYLFTTALNYLQLKTKLNPEAEFVQKSSQKQPCLSVLYYKLVEGENSEP